MGDPEEYTYTWEGRGGPFTILLAPGVFAPTHTSREVAEGLVINAGETVIDVGSGSGILSFVAARLGALRVFGTDINPRAVRIARRNARLLGLEDSVDFREGSLFAPLKGIRADVVIGDVSGIPDDIAAASDWFPGGYSGGPTGAEVPVAMLEEAREHLTPGGRLYLPTGSIQDEETVLRAARRVFGERMRQLRGRLLPLPTKITETVVVRRLMESGVVRFIRRGSRLLWELRVWECTLPPLPPAD
jgi:release factor glutamine methyltransferase